MESGPHVILYALSQKGQKQSILEGENGQRVQKLTVPDELIPRYLKIAIVAPDGSSETEIGARGLHVRAVNQVEFEWRPEKQRTELGTDSNLKSIYVEEWRPARIQKALSFDAPQTVEALLAVEEKRLKAVSEQTKEAVQAECDQRNNTPEAIIERQEAEQLVAETRQKRKEERERREAKVREKEELKHRELEEAISWAKEHGSERLKLIVEDGLFESSQGVYRDERLAAERPGWIWDDYWHRGQVEHLEPRNPSLNDLQWAREVRKTVPDAELIFAKLDPETDYDEYGEYYESGEKVREVVLRAEFLGRVIVLLGA